MKHIYDEDDIKVFNHKQPIDDGPIYFRPMKVILQVNPFYHKGVFLILTLYNSRLPVQVLNPIILISCDNLCDSFYFCVNLQVTYNLLAIQICQQEIDQQPTLVPRLVPFYLQCYYYQVLKKSLKWYLNTKLVFPFLGCMASLVMFIL